MEGMAMDHQTEQAAQQMIDVFQSVMPMFDKNLHLAPDPRNPKRRKDQRKLDHQGASAPQVASVSQMQEVLKIMA